LSTSKETEVTKRLSVLRLAIVVLGVSATTMAAAVTTETHLVQAMKGRYSDLKAAMAARDAKAIASLLAPGFVSEDVEGKTQAADSMIREIEALPRDPQRASETTVDSASLSGETVTVGQR
jgi:hypothetical protein